MKLQIDYDKKTITLENNVNLGDLFERIDQLLPEWKEWQLETKTEIQWSNPIYIERWLQPGSPWPNSPIYTGVNTTTGIYNIEC